MLIASLVHYGVVLAISFAAGIITTVSWKHIRHSLAVRKPLQDVTPEDQREKTVARVTPTSGGAILERGDEIIFLPGGINGQDDDDDGTSDANDDESIGTSGDSSRLERRI